MRTGLENLPFLRTYSQRIGEAVGGCDPGDCRAIVEFCLSRVPRDLLRGEDVEAAVVAVVDEEGGCERLRESLKDLQLRLNDLVCDAQARHDEEGEVRFSKTLCICGGLASVVGKTVLTPSDVDGFLYNIVNVMEGDPKDALEKFLGV